VKFLPAEHLNDLTNAIYSSVTTVDDLLRLLAAPSLQKDFNQLTAKSIPLRDNVTQICQAAFMQGWAVTFFEAALAANPDNPQLRVFAGTVASLPDGPRPVCLARAGRPSLECGRATQWASVQQRVRAPQHQVFLVMGEYGQASLHFRERVQTYLTDPKCAPLVIEWQSLPHSKDEYFSVLADALKCTPDTLTAALASRLEGQNIVLLHRLIRQDFENDKVVQYYSDWLPGLLQGITSACRLKAVQPIEWPPRTPSGLLDRFFKDDDKKGKGGAIALRERLLAAQSALMPITVLKDLVNLTDDELTDFVGGTSLKQPQQVALLKALHEARPVPEMQFETIDDKWNEILSL
jgi:hypothetical protein